jgi:hypothetical protein
LLPHRKNNPSQTVVPPRPHARMVGRYLAHTKGHSRTLLTAAGLDSLLFKF